MNFYMTNQKPGDGTNPNIVNKVNVHHSDWKSNRRNNESFNNRESDMEILDHESMKSYNDHSRYKPRESMRNSSEQQLLNQIAEDKIKYEKQLLD